MRDTLGALRQYVVAVPRPARPARVGGDVASQASPGDTLAYRMWACLQQSHQAYRSRYTAQQQSAEARDTLDKLPWEEALARGGPEVHIPRGEVRHPGRCTEVDCQQWQSYSRGCHAFRRLPAMPRPTQTRRGAPALAFQVPLLELIAPCRPPQWSWG